MTLVSGGPPVPPAGRPARSDIVQLAADPRARRDVSRWSTTRASRSTTRCAQRAATALLAAFADGAAGCRGHRGVPVRPPRLPLRARPADRGGRAATPRPRAHLLGARHPRGARRPSSGIATSSPACAAISTRCWCMATRLSSRSTRAFRRRREIADRLHLHRLCHARPRRRCPSADGSPARRGARLGRRRRGRPALLTAALEARRHGCLAELPLAHPRRHQPAGGRFRRRYPRQAARRRRRRALPPRFRRRCCGAVMSRSARPATTPCSTFLPRGRAPCWCRLPPNARPSS